MRRFILRRFGRMLLVLFILVVTNAIVLMSITRATSGPSDNRHPPLEVIQALNTFYHWDDPLLVQCVRYFYNVAAPFISHVRPGASLTDDALFNVQLSDDTWLKWMNFGPSYWSRLRSVSAILHDQLPATIQLGLVALIVAIGIGWPLGFLATLRPDKFWHRLGKTMTILGMSLPPLVLGPILIGLFSVLLHWLPLGGWGARPPFALGFLPSNLGSDFFKFAILPTLALGFGGAAIVVRTMQTSLRRVLHADYLRTAQAKGLTERRIMACHLLRNALLPVISVLSPVFVFIVTGTFVTELIFGIPGMSKYFDTSITNRDYPVITGTLVWYAIVLLVVDLVVDIVRAFLDPRLRRTSIL